MTLFCLLLVVAISRSGWGQTHDNGYWTPSTEYWPATTYYPTTYYPPTTAYTSYWSETYYTTWYTQNEVIVTITSTIPCPFTSTVIYYTYECNQCNQCSDCCDGYNNCCMYEHCYGYGVSTTQVTSYTTVPPSPVQTLTQNGVVVVVMDTGSYVQSLGATDQVQVVSGTGVPTKISTPALWISVAGILTVAALVVAL